MAGPRGIGEIFDCLILRGSGPDGPGFSPRDSSETTPARFRGRTWRRPTSRQAHRTRPPSPGTRAQGDRRFASYFGL